MSVAKVLNWSAVHIANFPAMVRPGEQLEVLGETYIVSVLVWREDGSCDLHLVPLSEWDTHQ